MSRIFFLDYFVMSVAIWSDDVNLRGFYFIRPLVSSFPAPWRFPFLLKGSVNRDVPRRVLFHSVSGGRILQMRAHTHTPWRALSPAWLESSCAFLTEKLTKDPLYFWIFLDEGSETPRQVATAESWVVREPELDPVVFNQMLLVRTCRPAVELSMQVPGRRGLWGWGDVVSGKAGLIATWGPLSKHLRERHQCPWVPWHGAWRGAWREALVGSALPVFTKMLKSMKPAHDIVMCVSVCV